MVIKTVTHFEIPAGDVDRLSKFYSDVFGWKFEKLPAMGDGGMDYWMISTGPRRRSIGGGMYKKMGVPNEGPRNYIAVEEIDSAIATFKSAGGNELVGKQEVPGFGWSYMGLDPEGNVVGLFQGVTRRQQRRKRRAAKKASRKSKSRR